MLYTFENSELFRPDMEVAGTQNLLICPGCGHKRPFIRRPMKIRAPILFQSLLKYLSLSRDEI